ncbi:MAG: hypothetical protein AAF517_10595, partial [Planctomycetota bacterium]
CESEGEDEPEKRDADPLLEEAKRLASTENETPKESDSDRLAKEVYEDTVAAIDRLKAAENAKSEEVELAAAVYTEPQPAPKAPEKKAVPAGPNRFVTISLAGDLGGARLDPADSQTWARLGFFVDQQSLRRHYLVQPGGSRAPVAVPGAGLKLERRAGPDRSDPGPVGNSSKPTYRLVIRAKSQSKGSVSFYGGSLAKKFSCTISCTVEKLKEGKYHRIQHVVAKETATPSKITGTTQQYQRRLYDVTVEELAKKLARVAPFRHAS